MKQGKAKQEKGQPKQTMPWEGLEGGKTVSSAIRFTPETHAKMKWVIEHAASAPRSMQKIVDAALESYLDDIIAGHVN